MSMFQDRILNPKLAKERGFTPLQLVMGAAGAILLLTLTILLVSRLYTENDNTVRLLQVRDYVTSLEVTYKESFPVYPSIQNGSGEVITTLEQYGCLAATIDDSHCLFDGAQEQMYPDTVGIASLSTIVPLFPLTSPVVDRDGDTFDSILYSSNGRKFRVKYPLEGDGVPCGIRNSYEIFAESPLYEGVTVCVYESH